MIRIASICFAFSVFVSVFGQGSKVCNSEAGICLHQISEKNTDTSFGFALPMSSAGNPDPFAKDFIVNITTPLPYGFSGFREASANAPLALVQWFIILPHQSPASPGTMIVQHSKLSTDGMSYLPLDGTTVTISPFSTWTSDHASFVFRCQKCAIFAPGKGPSPSGHISMTAFWSYSAPEYPSPTALNATLPLNDLITGTFSFNLADVRTAHYDAILASAGLA